MRTSLTILAFIAARAWAFPPWMFDMKMDEDEMRKLSHLAQRIRVENKVARDGILAVPGFNAEQQYVSNTGEHEFIAPGPTDLRGPCPGLNAMANHNYIPRNGVATISQFIQGTGDVFGMGVDLATFLAVYGAVFDGDLTSWSIGGPPPEGLLNTIGLLGQPEGITNSHNKYESDVSPTRGDLYQYGNDYKLVLSQFESLYTQPLGPYGYDLTTLTAFRAQRFQQSIGGNPYFFNGPFTGLAVQEAAYSFIYRFMANKSAEYPEGYLDGETLKAFFGISGDGPGSFTGGEGLERIPDNWYKRAADDAYTISYFALDLVAAALEHPEFLSVGGNTGTVDSFAGVDVANLTGGVFNAATLLEGNNALCFAFQFTRQAAPDILSGLFSDVAQALGQLDGALGSVLSSLGCPQLQSIDASQLAGFPGANGTV